MKKHLLFALLFAVASIASAQIKIPNTRLSFSFPEGGWKYLETSTPEKNVTVYLYSYAADYVIDNTGDTVLPFMRIYVNRNFEGSVYEMAYSRFNAQPFQSLDEYVTDNDGFGYLGAYTNNDDGKDYEFRMLYLKDKNTAIEIRLETTRFNFDDFDSKFLDILKTVKISK